MKWRLPLALGRAVDGANRVRAWGYEKGLLRKTKLKCPVVSIGNLTVGGTGKTPVVQVVARYFLNQKKRVAIVSRNYKAQVKEMAEVDPLRKGAGVYFGDEPTLLALACPGARVFVGPRKAETAAWAEKEFGPFDVLILDDGFQHWALHRDLDVVLIDATDEKGFELVPAGRARESQESLNRADYFLLTKINWATTQNIEKARSALPSQISRADVPFRTEWPEIEGESPIALLSGLARPEVFVAQARKKYFSRILEVWSFDDHHRYADADLSKIRGFLSRDPSALVVTTAKDAVKIEDAEIRARLRVAEVVAQIPAEDAFFEKLGNLVR